MRYPNRRLIALLALGWTGFLAAGLGLRQLSGPAVVIIIDHSFCPENQRQSVVETYRDLYQQHQQRQIQIEQVLFLSDLGEDVLEQPPPPAEVAELGFFGDEIDSKLEQARQQYPEARVLGCP